MGKMVAGKRDRQQDGIGATRDGGFGREWVDGLSEILFIDLFSKLSLTVNDRRRYPL
jgi:hypothetical protein